MSVDYPRIAGRDRYGRRVGEVIRDEVVRRQFGALSAAAGDMGQRRLVARKLVPDVPRDLPMGARDTLAFLQPGSTNPRHEHPGQTGAAAESPVRLFLRVAVGFRAGRDSGPP